MLEAYAAASKQGHTVAWDTMPKKGETHGAKAYGFYDCMKKFYASVLQNTLNNTLVMSLYLKTLYAKQIVISSGLESQTPIILC